MDAMYWVMLVARVLHVLSAIVLVGGIFYLRTVVAPAVPTDGSATADQWFGGRRATWAKWVGITTLLLLATGLFNFIRIIQTNESMGALYQALFGVKFLLALVLFGLAAMIAGKTSVADRLRQNMQRWLGVCLAIGLAIVVLASVLRSLPHVPVPSLPRVPAQSQPQVPNVDAGPPLLIQPSTGQPATDQ